MTSARSGAEDNWSRSSKHYLKRSSLFSFNEDNSPRRCGHSAPPQGADGALKITQRRRAAAGSCPPPPTLTTGTLSHTQRTTAQSVPGCQAANVKAAQSSSFCTTSRPSEPRLSSCMRQILPIAQVTDLRRENQSVNAWKQNGHPAQTARKGKAGARAG